MISLDSNGNNDLISEEDLMDLVKADIFKGNIDLDEIMASATHARKSRVIDVEYLSKV